MKRMRCFPGNIKGFHRQTAGFCGLFSANAKENKKFSVSGIFPIFFGKAVASRNKVLYNYNVKIWAKARKFGGMSSCLTQ